MRVVVAVAVGLTLAVVAGAAAGSKPLVVPGAKFRELPPGWRAFDSDFTYLTRRGASINTYALSWPYRQNPTGWAPNMPRNAIAVSVILIRRSLDPGTNLCLRTPHERDFPPRRLPLRLPRTTTHRLEGEPGVLEYRVFGRIGESYAV